MPSGSQKTVLILAYECAPYNRPGSVMGAQRPHQFAKYLPEFGWRTILLCCDFPKRYNLDPKQDWQEIIHKIVSEKIERWDGSEKKSLKIALPSLKYADSIDRQWLNAVEIEPGKGTLKPKGGIKNQLTRKASSLLKYFRGDHSQSWQHVAYTAFEILLKNNLKPDIVMAEHGPDGGLFVARQIYRKYQIPWVADCRDPLLMGFPGFSKRLISAYYKYVLLKTAKGLINVNPIWVKREGIRFAKPGYLVTNGFDPSEMKELNIANKKAGRSNEIVIIYYGNFYPFQEMEGFLCELGEICQQDSGLKKRIRFVYYGNAFSKVTSWVNKYQLENNFEGRSFIPRSEVFEKVKEADLLLLLSVAPDKYRVPEDFASGFYPGKVFEYFGFRIPILCFPGDGSILSQLILDTGSGYVVPVKGLYAFLDRYDADKNKLSFDVSLYSREKQSQKMAGVLTDVLRSE